MTDKELSFYSYGVLNGWLKSISRFNDKDNNGYNFELQMVDENESINVVADNVFNRVADNIELQEIELYRVYLIELMLNKWFFSYQEENSDHLVDTLNPQSFDL